MTLPRGFGGLLELPVYVSRLCTKPGTTHRTFPASRHRSKRIEKKLLRRHGGEFHPEPAMLHFGDGIVCHPALYAELKREMARAAR